VAVALRDDRGLEVDVAEGPLVAESLRELERALDVLARPLPVALAAVAARAPREDVRPEQVARHAGPLGERQRLAEEADRGRDAGKLVAADADAVHQVGAVDVRERIALDEAARLVEVLERDANLSALHPSPALAAERADAQLRRTGGENGVLDVDVVLNRVVVLVILRQRLGANQRRLDARPLVGGDAACQERRVDAEPGCDPLDRLLGRARLAALDLADVLLREPVAGELGLRDAGRDPELAHALAEARGARGDPGCGLDRVRHHDKSE